MAVIDKPYQKLLDDILTNGYEYEDPNRKGVIRTEIDEYTIRHDLTREFPAITTKKLAWKSVVGELIWFLRGDTNIKYLVDNGIPIWNKDAYNYYLKVSKTKKPYSMEEFLQVVKKEHTTGLYDYGDLGPVYGQQWRNIKDPIYEYGNYVGYKRIDQLGNLLSKMKDNPLATDLIVNAWNAKELKDMALKPCHFGFQVMVRPLDLTHREKMCSDLGATWELPFTEKVADKWKVPKYGFTLKWEQRSVDTFLGLPFNIASYALLAHIIGRLTNTVPLKLVGSLSKVHIYDNAKEQSYEQLYRDVDLYKGSQIKFHKEFDVLVDNYRNGSIDLDTFSNKLTIDMFELNNYESHPALKAKMLAYKK